MIEFDANYTMTIGGKAVVAQDTFAAWNPATRREIARVPDGNLQHLNEAVAAAKTAFKDWKRVPLARRQDAVRRIGEALERNAESFMALLTKEQGKPRAGAQWEILGSVHWLREIATLPEERSSRIPRSAGRHPVLATRRGRRHRAMEFSGAAGGMEDRTRAHGGQHDHHQAFAIYAAVHPEARRSCAGVAPPWVFSVLSGGDELGKWMTSHPDLAKIAFTGHTETGKHVMRSAAGTLKRLTLELGGNDPAIVLPDVDPGGGAAAVLGGVPEQRAVLQFHQAPLCSREDL